MNPEWAAWDSRLKTNFLLADLWDMLANINANLVAIGSRRPAKRIKPYPRPKTKEQDSENKRHFGRDALPVNELHEWFEKMRAKHATGSTGDNSGDSGPGGSAAISN